MSASQPRSRYPGSIAFAREDHALFFGREKELKKLYDLLQIKKMLIFFSASGMGKSSLINAGLIPMMEKRMQAEHTLPVPVRFFYYDQQLDKDPRALVNKIIMQLRQHRKNLPISELPLISNIHKDSLWYELKLFAINNIKVILIIDQSEEIFDYPEDQVNTLKDELYDIYSGVPQKVDEQCTEQVAKLESSLQNQEELMQLDKEVEFIYADMNTKVLMAIREDKLGLFNAFTDYFPDMLKDSYKLLPLTAAAATNAIQLPAAVEGNFLSKNFSYAPETLELLLDKLQEKKKPGTYDPFTIQITCRFIENRIIINQHKTVVGPSDIPRDMSEPVKRFIEDTWKNIPGNFGKYMLKERIEKELIEHDRGSRISAHENSKWIKPEVSDYLVKQGFLKRDRRDNLDYLELSHDRLVAPLSRDYHSRLLTTKQMKRSVWVIGSLLVLFFIVEYFNQKELEKRNLINNQLTNLNKQLDSVAETSISTLKSLSQESLSQQGDTGVSYADNNPVAFNAVDSSLNKILLKKYNKQLFKVDIFYANPEQLRQFPALAYGDKTADSILQVLSKQRNFIVRKRMLRSVSGRFRTTENIIWYNGNEELQQADSIRALVQQAYGENSLVLLSRKTSSRSENYLSIVIKNTE